MNVYEVNLPDGVRYVSAEMWHLAVKKARAIFGKHYKVKVTMVKPIEMGYSVRGAKMEPYLNDKGEQHYHYIPGEYHSYSVEEFKQAFPKAEVY